MLKKELEILIKPIITNGFKYKKEIKGFSWTKTLSDKKEGIIIGYRTFYSNMFELYCPYIYIYFDRVEDILEKFLKKYNVENIWGLPSTIHSTLRNIKGINYGTLETRVNDELNFQIVADEVKKIVEYGAMPFFEKYQMLESVNEEINKRNDDNINDFLSGIIRLKVPLINQLK